MTNTIQRPHWLSRDSFDKLLDRVAPLPQCVQCKAIEDLTIDHIVPRYAGGNDDLSNLQIMCRSCNSRKGIRDDSYWAHHFYWDRLPAPEGLVHLREAQRQLFLAIDQDPYFERNASEIARLLYICAWVVGSGKTLGLAVAAWA